MKTGMQSEQGNALNRCVLGTAGLGGVWGQVDPDESIRSILTALERGITAIDTAPAYGDAESFVCKALQQWPGSLPQISTKVGRLKGYRADEGYYDFSYPGLEKSLERSLKTLGVPAIDILFLHDPSAISSDEAPGVIKKMLEFKQKGYARKIGLGGNSPDWFRAYMTPDIFDVVMEYNRLSACCLDALSTSLDDCESLGMEFYAASPLHMGLLGSRFNTFTDCPPVWLKKREVVRAIEMKGIADRYHISLSSLSHRFLLGLPHHFKIVIGAANSAQLQNTLADFAAGPLPQYIYDEIFDKRINQPSINE